MTGQDFLTLAATKLGDPYVFGSRAKLDDPKFRGPWDCAEFVTYIVKQVTGKLYGVTEDGDPYTGGWLADLEKGKVIGVPVAQATLTPGAILLRCSSAGHHIVFSDGMGRTIEAMGRKYGVCRGSANNRQFGYGILIPGVKYGK